MNTDQQSLTCPGCQRATRPQTAKLADWPGTIHATLKDGTCVSCWRYDHGWKEGRSDRRKRTGLPVTPERTEENRRTLEAFLRRRRARLGPEEGVAA